MNVFGYQKNKEELIQLDQEVTFCMNLDEVDTLINFLKHVKNKHSKVNQICHSHLQDFTREQRSDSVDFIVVTGLDTN